MIKPLQFCTIVLLFIFSGKLVSGQNACDSLQIEVQFDAFNDSLIVVKVKNNSSQLFSYPGFVIIDNNGDTIAKEQVNFFGISSESTHYLQLNSNTFNTAEFGGKLELWSGFFTTLECSYNMNFNLCPDACEEYYIYLGNFGGSLATGSMDWEITDSNSTAVISGKLFLTDSTQNEVDTVCLLPGGYNLKFKNSPGLTGGQVVLGIAHMNLFSSVNINYTGSDTSLSLNLFERCTTGTFISSPEKNKGIKIYSSNDYIKIINNNKEDWIASVYTISGQLTWKGNIKEGDNSIFLSHLPSGIYIVEAHNSHEISTQKVFLE